MTEYKNNPFLLSPKSQPKGPHHGNHRKASPPVHSSAAKGADKTSHNGTGNPAAPTIPYAGIRAGEIIGWRLWLVDMWQLDLHSVASNYIWHPGCVAEGDVNKFIGYAANFFSSRAYNLPDEPIFGGVYSYKDRDYVTTQALCFNDCIAMGTISCWGEVVEHELGYRAQYARITSLDYFISPFHDPQNRRILSDLRQRYLTSPQPLVD